MLKAPFSRIERRGERSSALVIVLFFVVLLTAVAIAFLSRSLTAVQVSAGSSTETKSKILAVSASDIIIGDFRQEIIAGSTNYYSASNTTNNSGTVWWPVYTPTSTTNAIPFMNGVPVLGGTNAIPNMISRSVSPANTSGTAPYVAYPSSGATAPYTSTLIPPNRAASDTTASGTYTSSKVNSSYASLNGRYISPSQWNEHYLIPRNTAVDPSGTITTDSTPTANFVPPDWVIVTRGGVTSVSATTPGFGTGGLNDTTLTNTNCAVGRYAYAVYNEGGLLDMNAAGYPSGLTSTQISEKGALALADLTQLTTASGSLTQTQINNLVAWRNYASAGLTSSTGSFGSASFTATTASNWLTNFVTSNTNGFMQVVPPPSGYTPPPSDQAFLSRQQLISVTQSLGISPDYLQYMGTFSRALEQPSTAPDPGRPTILTDGNANSYYPPAYGSADSYVGNNNYLSTDTGSVALGVNPSFLNVRVKSSFTRNNGVSAVVNEPLVKTKFPLSYLSWITYLGPSATRTSVINNNAASYSSPSSTDYDIYLLETKYGVTNAFLQQGTTTNVKNYFGLTYNSTSAWTYNHGQNYILPLTQLSLTVNGTTSTSSSVYALSREPDFAELLKASIVAGSLAKGGPNVGNTYYNYQYANDVALDNQVLQIMANLIDQQDCDSYPTAITLGTTSTVAYGVEDLPYFYRYHLMAVPTRLPNPKFSTGLIQTFTGTTSLVTTGTLSGTSVEINSANPAQTVVNSWTLGNNAANASGSLPPSVIHGVEQGTLVDPGSVTYMFIPEVWNPHDPNTANTLSTANSALRPSKFRLFAQSNDPSGLLSPWQMEAISEVNCNGSSTGTTTVSGTVVTQLTAYYAGSTSSPIGIIPKQDPSGSYSTYYIWPISSNLSALSSTTGTLTFNDNGGALFREPTLLWNNHPWATLSGTLWLSATGTATDINTGQTYYGIIQGKAPISFQASFNSKKGGTTTVAGTWTGTANTTNAWSGQIDGTWIFEGTTVGRVIPSIVGQTSYTSQIMFVLQYQDPANSGNWITYDQKYPDMGGMSDPNIIPDAADDDAGDYMSPWPGWWQHKTPANSIEHDGDSQITGAVTCMDPRTPRWSMATNSQLGKKGTNGDGDFLLEPTANSLFKANSFGTTLASVQYNVVESDRPRAEPGNEPYYSTPCATSDSNPPLNNNGKGLRNAIMRWFAAGQYRAWSPAPTGWPLYFPGLFSQNNSTLQSAKFAQDGVSVVPIYNEDPDGVNRPGMGAYNTAITDSGTTSQASSTLNTTRVGLPMVTASIMNDNATLDTTQSNGGITQQSQSRPIILNRPFRSVSDMSYCFSGTPWKNIDFFNPSSGDSALLDTFCINPIPPSGMVAGKVDLNTRQIPVLQAIVAGTYIDELNNAMTTPPSYALTTLTGTEAYNVAYTLENITSDTTHSWRGPLKNISGLVGRYVATPSGTTTDTDLYTYKPPTPVTGQSTSVSYAGLSAALSGTFNGSNQNVYANTSVTPYIQRFREAGLRSLTDAGQVRVWNLLIDVIAQTGRYPKTATSLDQFVVTGQSHLWVHVAIDRYTGQVIDKQVETVTP
jgi:hypothetical protein